MSAERPVFRGQGTGGGGRSRRWRVAGGLWRVAGGKVKGQEIGGRGRADGVAVLRCCGVSVSRGHEAEIGIQRSEVGGRIRLRVRRGERLRREEGRLSEARSRRSEVGSWSAMPYAPCALRRERTAFTLVELLVTVAIIAIMSTLLTPAVRGLMGVAGPRGGVNVVSSAIEQARLSALESGQPSFVGFPFQSGELDEDLRYSSLIVFRKGRKEENEPAYVPVTRWLRLPQGVFIEGDLNQTESPGSAIPQLAGKAVSTLAVVAFDRFGKLYQTEDNVVIKVGQKAEPNGQFMGGSDQHFEVTVQALTGRAMVVDKAKEGA